VRRKNAEQQPKPPQPEKKPRGADVPPGLIDAPPKGRWPPLAVHDHWCAEREKQAATFSIEGDDAWCEGCGSRVGQCVPIPPGPVTPSVGDEPPETLATGTDVQ